MNRKANRLLSVILSLLMCLNTFFMPVMAEGNDTSVPTEEPVEEVLQEENTVPEEPETTEEPGSAEETPIPEIPSETEEPVIEEPVETEAPAETEAPVIEPEETVDPEEDLSDEEEALEPAEEEEEESELFANPESDFTYTTSSGKVTITKYKGTSASVEIPSTIGGNPVTVIGASSFSKNTTVTDVIVPENITQIASNAFYQCTNLRSISLPDTLTMISNNAFTGCSSLSHIRIPGSVTGVGSEAFSGCDLLRSAGPIGSGADYEFGWTDTVPSNAFYKMTSLTSAVFPEGITTIKDYAFYYCSSLTEVSLPSTLTTLKFDAFAGCSSLPSIEIPSGVTKIDSSVFGSCKNLSSVTLPSGITMIDFAAFSGCSSLKEITIPEAVTSIGESAFKGCSSLESITIPDSVTKFGYNAFKDCTSLSVISLPGTLKYNNTSQYGKIVFENCPLLKTAGPETSNANIRFRNLQTVSKIIVDSGLFEYLEEIDIPSGVTAIEASAFSGLASLRRVSVPGTVTSVGTSAFMDGASLNSINLPDSITSIGSGAFKNCASLGSVTLPKNLTIINGSLFSGCKSITEMIIPSGVTKIDSDAFLGCTNLSHIVIPAGVTEMGAGVFTGCTSLTTAGPTGSGADVEFGWTESIPKYAFRNLTSLTDVTIPDTVTAIGSGAFEDCDSLTAVVIPDGVKVIDSFAFSYCKNLSSISLPSSLTTLGNSAFASCPSLQSAVISGTNAVIGDAVFASCTKLADVEIRDGVTSIGKNVFSKCDALTHISVPASLTTIASDTFTGCTALVTAGPAGSGADYEYGWTASIPKYAFTGITSLNSAAVRPGITSIGDYAFKGCTGLNHITMPASTVTFGTDAFVSCSGITSAAPAGSGTGYEYSWTDEIPDRAFADLSALATVSFPDTITRIGSNAFKNCSKLVSVTVPESVTEFGNAAFYGCGFSEFTLPSRVTEIPGSMFGSCGSLKTVNMPAGLKTIGDSAFGSCRALNTFTVPYGVTYLGKNLFTGCDHLTTVTIPDTVTTIGYSAFAVAYYIKDVYFGGTQEQWKELEKSSIGLTSKATVHYDLCLYGHKYGTPVYTWTKTADGYDVHAKAVCGNDSSHIAEETVHAAHEKLQEVSCDTDGIDKYTAVFTDSLFKAQTKQITEPAWGHDYQEPVYTWTETDDGYSVTAYTVCSHDPSHEVSETVNAVYTVPKKPLCEESGTGLYTASFSSTLFSVQTKETVIDPIGHEYQYSGFVWTGSDEAGYTAASAEYICSHDDTHRQYVSGALDIQRTEPLCETDGSVVYTVSVTAEDSIDGKAHTETKTVVLPATGHDYEVMEYGWNETETGYDVSAYAVCRNDHDHELRETVHAVYSVKQAPDCESQGTGLYTASFEHADVFAAQTKETVIDPIGHEYQYSGFVWTGSDEAGYTAASAEYICTHDDTHRQYVSVALDIQRTEPLCETDGSVVYTVSVAAEDSIDGKAHTETKTVVLPATGHDYQTPEYTWTKTDSGYEVSAYSVCAGDASHIARETVTAVYSVKVQPACEREGTGVYTASFKHEAFSTQTKEEPIEPIGHDYRFKSMDWFGSDSSGYYSARGQYTCTHSAYHTQTISVPVTSETTDSTCETAGKTVYTAVIPAEKSYDGTEHKEQKTVVIAPKGHSYGTPEYTWTKEEDGYTVEAKTVCANDPSHIVTETKKASYRVKTAPKCEASGTGVYTVTFDNALFTTQTKTEVIPRTGHNYGEPEYTWRRDSGAFYVSAQAVCLNDSSHILKENVAAGFEVVEDPDPSVIRKLYTATFTKPQFETQTKLWTCVSGVSLDQTELTFEKMRDVVWLQPTVYPADASDQSVTYISSDPDTVYVGTYGDVHPLKSGTAVVTCTTNEDGKTAECLVTVNILSTTAGVYPKEATLERGEKTQLKVTVSPLETANKAVTWYSSDESVATVDQNGLVTAVKTGTAVIYVITQDTGIRSIVDSTITVVTTPKSITLSETDAVIAREDTLRLYAQIEPSDADNTNVLWTSSDSSVASVDEDGLVTAVSRGNAVITAKTESGELSAQCNITVDVPVRTIYFDTEDVSMYKGDITKLNAVIQPADADDAVLTYTSSNESVATVDENGTVTAINCGRTVITATDIRGNAAATCVVFVKEHAQSVEIEQTVYDLTIGDAVSLHPYVLPEDAEHVTFTYASSDSSVATITENGVVTGNSEGTSTITISALNGTLTKTVSVNVTKVIPGQSGVITANSQKLLDFILKNGSTNNNINYNYIPVPIGTGSSGVGFMHNKNNPDEITIWAVISERTKKSVLVDYYNGSVLATFNIKTGAVHFLISDESYQIEAEVGGLVIKGDMFNYGAMLDDDSMYDFDPFDHAEYSVTSNNSTRAIADYYSINANAMLSVMLGHLDTFLKNKVKITDGAAGIGFSSLSYKYRNRLYPAVKSTAVTPAELTLLPGETSDIEVVVTPDGAPIGSVEWVNKTPEVIEVYGTGTNKAAVRALKPGIGTIEVNNSYVKNKTVTVTVPEPVVLPESEKFVIIDQTTFPQKMNVNLSGYTDNDLIWTSSDPNVLSVDENGNYTVHRSGTAVITAKTDDGRFYAQCTITAVDTILPESLTLNKTELTLVKGETDSEALIPEILPANTSNKHLIWSSSDEKVAAVDENGTVTAVSNGTAVITARTEAGNLTVTCNVTVIVPVTGIELSAPKLDILKGETGTVTATVLPLDATNQKVIWSSADESIATVDQDGVITAVEGGITTITAETEDGNYTASCEVRTVVLAEGVNIITDLSEIQYGDTAKLEVQFTPANTTNQKVIWRSSNESVLKVNENGVITPAWEGTADIIAISEDGSFTDSREIKVLFTHAEKVGFENSETTVTAGASKKLNLVFEPENASEKGAHFEVIRGNEYLEVDENTGEITGIKEFAERDDTGTITQWKPGEAVVRATTKDGQLTAECTVKVYPDMVFAEAIEDQDYTGKALKPELKVWNGDQLLTLNTDYTVSYKNNTKAGTATATLKMKGNYTGTRTTNFNIRKASLNDDKTVIADPVSVQATGKVLKPVPAVYFNGKKLKNNTDYIVDYGTTEIKEPGTYNITVNGNGNFEGSRTVKVRVAAGNQKPVSKLKVTAKSIPYSSLAVQDKVELLKKYVSVLDGKTPLVYGTDYVFDVPNGMNQIGTYTVLLKGTAEDDKEGYAGERNVTVKVTGTNLADKKLVGTVNGEYVFAPDTAYKPDGKNITWKLNKKEITLAEDRDYEIADYQNNDKAGTAKIILEGKGEYYGTKTLTFKIQPKKDITLDDVNVAEAHYAKGGAKPEVTIENLTLGTDYTVKYGKNNKVGAETGSVTITFKGNYKGNAKLTKKFEIKTKDFSEVTITAKDLVVSAKAGKYKSTPVLKDTDGKTLKAGTDYDKAIEYEEVTEDGDVIRKLGPKDVITEESYVKVTVTGKGNYTGDSISTTYRILPAGYDISKLKITAVKKEYTGREVTLDPADLTFKSGRTELNLEYGKDYEITGYTNNLKKGTATVTIHGIGSYGGEKTVKFTITQRNIKTRWEGILEALGF